MAKARRSYRKKNVKKTKKGMRRTRRKVSGGKGSIGMRLSGRSRGSSGRSSGSIGMTLSGRSRGSSGRSSSGSHGRSSDDDPVYRKGAEWKLPETSNHLDFNPEKPFSAVYKNPYTGKDLFTLTVGPYKRNEDGYFDDPEFYILPEYTPVLQYHMDFTNADLTTPRITPPPEKPKTSMFGSMFSKKPEPVRVQTPEDIEYFNLSVMTVEVNTILKSIGVSELSPGTLHDKRWQPTDSLTLYTYSSPKKVNDNYVTLMLRINGGFYKPSTSSFRPNYDSTLPSGIQDYLRWSVGQYTSFVLNGGSGEKFSDAEYLLQMFLNERFSNGTIVLNQ